MVKESTSALEKKIDAVVKSVDKLAAATKHGFDEVQKHFDEVYKRMDTGFEQVNEHLDRIEFHVSGHDRRIEVLEDKMRQIAVKVGLRFN